MASLAGFVSLHHVGGNCCRMANCLPLRPLQLRASSTMVLPLKLARSDLFGSQADGHSGGVVRHGQRGAGAAGPVRGPVPHGVAAAGHRGRGARRPRHGGVPDGSTRWARSVAPMSPLDPSAQCLQHGIVTGQVS